MDDTLLTETADFSRLSVATTVTVIVHKSDNYVRKTPQKQ